MGYHSRQKREGIKLSQLLPVVLEGTASATGGGQRRPLAIKQKLAYIANDSTTYDLKVNFNKTIQEDGTFTLKAGEVLSDIPLICQTISLEGVGGSVAFRILGV
jgi:hypothetical protein